MSKQEQTGLGLKATAKAPANIALIKFWGKKDEKLRLPMNNSISINLSEAYTTTSVEFDQSFLRDEVTLDGLRIKGEEEERVVKHLDRVRQMADMAIKAKVVTRNNFPKGTGIASSASGFAALSMAAATAAGLKLTQRQLSILARLGSGSACRSIPSGWVEWKEGNKSNESYAHSLHDPKYWDVRDVIVVVNKMGKKVSSTEGHSLVESSPFYKSRIAGMKDKVREIKVAIDKKDFTKMGEIMEAEAVNMHAVMMTSKPALFYWSPATLELILSVMEFRKNGLEAYYTIDAGPNVHIMCLKKDVARLTKHLTKLNGVEKVIINEVANGTHLI